jgi:hypothetical protein
MQLDARLQIVGLDRSQPVPGGYDLRGPIFELARVVDELLAAAVDLVAAAPQEREPVRVGRE